MGAVWRNQLGRLVCGAMFSLCVGLTPGLAAGPSTLDICKTAMSCIHTQARYSTAAPPISLRVALNIPDRNLATCTHIANSRPYSEVAAACEAFLAAGNGTARERAEANLMLGFAIGWSKPGTSAWNVEAVAIWNKAIAIDPDFAEPYLAIGNILAISADPMTALIYFERLLAIHPDEWRAHTGQAKALRYAKKHWRAKEAAKKAVKLAPHEAKANYVLAEMYFLLGEWQMALPHYESAVANYNEQTWRTRDLEQENHPLRGLAKTYAKLGRHEEALATFDGFLSAYPHEATDPSNLLQRADLLEAAGRLAEAAAVLEQTLPLADASIKSDYAIKRAILLVKLGHAEKASKAIDELLEHDTPHMALVLQVFLKNHGFKYVRVSGVVDSATRSALQECLSIEDCSGLLSERI